MIHNCKIKDNSLNITVREIEPNRINKLGRTLVNLKQRFNKAFNVPQRTRIVRVSNHTAKVGQKEKKLEKNIIVEHKYFEGKQVLKVKTDINLKCLMPL